MGKVYLIGAGPGDPELLTVKAARILAPADVILHDALVTQEILELASPKARIINVGKRCGQKLLTQDEINAYLIHASSVAGIVVRLKSGDPLIFGRAGEEIEALQYAGVEFEIVPGITSALAAAAAARVSLTDRRFASQVLFTTAHRKGGEMALDWATLIRPAPPSWSICRAPLTRDSRTRSFRAVSIRRLLASWFLARHESLSKCTGPTLPACGR